jgi:hypothetical protein
MSSFNEIPALINKAQCKKEYVAMKQIAIIKKGL